MSYYAGLDLHGKNTVIGIINDQGQRVYKSRVANYLGLILNELEPFHSELVGVVVESTFNWYWLVDGLIEAGYQVHLAHPAANKQYEGLKYTNDFHDALYLAQLLRLGILAEGYIYPQKERAVRDLLRKRLMLVRQRTAHILSFKSFYNRHTGKNLPRGQLNNLKEDELEEIFQDSHILLTAKASLSTIEFLNHQIQQIEKVVLHFMKPTPEFEKLLTIPGIGNILALTIALETGASLAWVITLPTAAVSPVKESLMKKEKVKTIAKTVINTSAGLSLKQPTSPSVTPPRLDASINVNSPHPIKSSLSKLSPISGPAPPTSSSATESFMTKKNYLRNLAAAGNRCWGWLKNHWPDWSTAAPK